MPLDYAQPGGPHIAVALVRRPASNPAMRIGSLVVNPGGPGESGLLNFDKDLSVLPTGMLARFDVVGFDPRGIGKSSPIHCPAGGAASGPAPDPVPQTAAARDALVAADRAYAQGCAHDSGDLLLAHVGSVDVARDLDRLRSAVGDPGLSYLGLSYGSLLGATYADLFPTRVRAMALDGILDPTLPTDALADAQAAGFERSLDAFFAWCVPATCAWHPAEEAHTAFRSLVASVRQHPLGALGPGELYTATFGTLYARNFWPSLGTALAALGGGDPGPMLGLYHGYERTNDPSFNGDANNAVTCLDHPVPRDLAAYPARAGAAATAAPDFGPLFAWGLVSCAVWPVPDAAIRVPHPISAAGSGPILVVGTRNDPATPYAWAQSLAAGLAHGTLLTREGYDHVAIFTSDCVRSADEAVLVDLRLAAPGTVCA
ncbi:MAG: alpha/beta hydrolase [Acidimicrobiales bacterium]